MSITEGAPLVEIENVAKVFARRTVVAGVGFRLAPGEVLGLVGGNGGGKTTTLRILAGLLEADAGAGDVPGRSVRSQRGPAWRRDVGYMTQANALYPDLSVAENLRFRARIQARRGTDPGALAQSVAARFGLAPVLGQRVATLSGGWARRAQFAATVIHGPRLLLLDEPTAGLDVLSRRDLWAWIWACASEGMGVVISTHDLAEAATLPRVLFYHAGRAGRTTTPAELCARAGTPDLGSAVAHHSAAGTL